MSGVREPKRAADDGVLSAIGRTPLVRLNRVIPEAHFQLYAKLEALNPGGSTKDRPALAIIKDGIESGRITENTVIVESSSGNLAIGLAQVCAYHRLPLVCVVDVKTTPQNIAILQAYGAEVDVVSRPDPHTGEYLQARLDRVQELLGRIPNSFWPNQYANPQNPHAHYGTMAEIVEALDGRVDILYCATSTCGTLRGCADYARQRRLSTRIVAVDAVGSVIFGGVRGSRLIPGHGAAVRPQLCGSDLAQIVVRVTDLDCVVGCRRLARKEALLAGGSSGGLIVAIERTRHLIADGATCVTIFPDGGDRYLDTIYADSWVARHFGDVSHLWNQGRDPTWTATAC